MPRPAGLVVIHQATDTDQQAVVHLLAAQLHEHGVQTSTAKLTAAVEGILQYPERGSLLVAKVTGRPVGCVCCGERTSNGPAAFGVLGDDDIAGAGHRVDPDRTPHRRDPLG